ncbi:Predicted lipid-binding transport protein, Tim44 family [Halopseudomonas xinjiangensis]|uniref:Predicted lipid-binding transport protein, Tim44 family n=1 Tax=Halopseudomonas xinjiangensis TaxID=487184 RepID=A0A1H1LFR5_9GAMM|nr:TIM44-like domain-containing protein [Halopseudomonas xinjiangensis]SDR73356.1 Predicted lipid-binding transport protein, Tim44 family [Halopseudomonas xinjiangensis]
MRWLLPFFTVFLMLGVAIPEAEARRMGGGKSFGSAPMHRSQPAQQRQQQQQRDERAAQQQQRSQTVANSGARRWLGPLAGIAAGGLLAAMLFGDGFEGIQLFDILMFALIAFILFKLFSRRSAAAHQRHPVPAGHAPAGAWQREAEPETAPASSAAGNHHVETRVPAWFDAERFLRGAEEHFFTLQRHWRDGDEAGMAEYMSPELLREMLATRRAEPPTANGFVEQLQVRLDGIEEENGRAIATVGFTGLDRDTPEDSGQWFDESWRLERDAGENQPWVITGIRQNS